MMLRIMLVGLVASLGLELPSNDDVSHWTRSGRQWASARLAELSEIQSETGRAFEGLAENEPNVEPPAAPAEALATSDAAFQAAADRVAGDLAADLAAVAAPAPELIAKAEVVPTPAASDPLAADSDEIPSDEEEVAMRNEAGPSRAERINSAVKMTYQAVNAWASALGATDEVDASR